MKVKIVKNKVAPPFRTTEFDIMYNEGISLSGDTLDTGVIYKVIEKRGNTYTFGEEKLGTGRETAKAYLKQNPKLFKAIRAAVMTAVEKGEALDEEAPIPPEDEVPPPAEE